MESHRIRKAPQITDLAVLLGRGGYGANRWFLMVDEFERLRVLTSPVLQSLIGDVGRDGMLRVPAKEGERSVG